MLPSLCVELDLTIVPGDGVRPVVPVLHLAIDRLPPLA
jgi:hypothetical protein